MWDKNQTARWSATCALLAILIITGCTSSSEPVAEVPDASATAGNPVGSPVTDTAAPSPTATDLPSATPSQTPVPPTQPPSPTPTVTATPTPTPTSTPIPSPTPTPTPTLRQLTQGSCCTQPFWAPDSQQLLFIDKPGPDLPTGIWGVDVTESEPTPELLTEQIAFYTPDLNFRTELNQDSTTIERLASPLPSDDDSSGTGSSPETSWEVPSEGQPVYISPGEQRIVWQVSNPDLPFERRTAQIWVADLDGSIPQMVADVPRGGFNGWISDDVILLSGRETLEAQEQVLFALSLNDGSKVELARGKRLRGGLLSPEGTWLAYFVALDEDPSQNGVWLVRSDGTERHELGSELFGAYQWRDDHRLLFIPFQPGAASHEFWEFDVSTGQSLRLTVPEVTPFKIANGDWTISPDGRQVAFVESQDRNIWLLTLPD